MDDVDLTCDREEYSNAARLEGIRRQVSAMPTGEPGECDKCGEDSPRLVRGVCAPCRDKFKLP